MQKVTIQKNQQMLKADYSKAIEILNNIPQFLEGYGVDRCKVMLNAMGNPEKQLKVIHVAGTNGKGSVCAYLDRILRENGYKVGLFTSPHLIDIRERIKINGDMISEEAFLSGFNKVRQAVASCGLEPAYFDYLLGIAVLFFVEENVDFCIMETGLGGRLDATNAIDNKVLNVITGVSLEHTTILGNTVEQIAAEKAGIVHGATPVVYMDKSKAVTDVINMKACSEKSDCVEVNYDGLRIIKNTGKSIDFSVHNRYYIDDCFTITTGAVYQVENCAVALTAAAYLEKECGVSMDADAVRQAVQLTNWMGRMEEIADRVYVDGAHNPEGIEAFVRSVAAIAKDSRSCLFFSVVNDKDYTAMIKTLCESDLFDMYVVTQLAGSRKLEGERIKDIFCQFTDKEVVEFDDIKVAYDYALKRSREENAYCFCAGSLYLVGEIKAFCDCE